MGMQYALQSQPVLRGCKPDQDMKDEQGRIKQYNFSPVDVRAHKQRRGTHLRP